jgi:hypothetical protein
MKILSKIILVMSVIALIPVLILVIPGLILFNLSEAVGGNSRLPEEL